VAVRLPTDCCGPYRGPRPAPQRLAVRGSRRGRRTTGDMTDFEDRSARAR